MTEPKSNTKRFFFKPVAGSRAYVVPKVQADPTFRRYTKSLFTTHRVPKVTIQRPKFW